MIPIERSLGDIPAEAQADIERRKAMMPKKFWLVWCPTGTTMPKHKHFTLTNAMTEAARLAALHPGQSFYALEARSVSECPKPAVKTAPLVD